MSIHVVTLIQKSFWIHTVSLLLALIRLSTPVLLGQSNDPFPPVQIGDADAILQNAKSMVEKLPKDIDLVLTKVIPEKRLYNLFFDTQALKQVKIEPEEAGRSILSPDDYIKSLKNRYDSIDMQDFIVLNQQQFENPCDLIFYQKSNPNYGQFSLKVLRTISVRQKRNRAIETIQDTAEFSFSINLLNPALSNLKIVSILRWKDKTHLPSEKVKAVNCLEDADELLWSQARREDLPSSYKKYLETFQYGRHRYAATLRRHFINQRLKDLMLIKNMRGKAMFDALKEILKEYNEQLVNSPLKQDIENFINNLNDGEEDFRRKWEAYSNADVSQTISLHYNQIQSHLTTYNDICGHEHIIVELIDLWTILTQNPEKKQVKKLTFEKENLSNFLQNHPYSPHRKWIMSRISQLDKEISSLEDKGKEKKEERRQKKKDKQASKKEDKPKTKKSKRPPKTKNPTSQNPTLSPRQLSLAISRGIAYEQFYSSPSLLFPESAPELLLNGQQFSQLELTYHGKKGFLLSVAGGIKQGKYGCGNIWGPSGSFLDSCQVHLEDHYTAATIFTSNISVGYDFFPKSNFLLALNADLQLEGGEYPRAILQHPQITWASQAENNRLTTKYKAWAGVGPKLVVGFGPTSRGYGMKTSLRYIYLWEVNQIEETRLFPQINFSFFVILAK
ncbi:MAG: hypothetical protein AAF587_33210 [Bacteroidota bacterium]